MKHVATAGAARPLSDTDRAALVAAHRVVFGGDGPLDPADAADGEYPDWYHPSA